jgi:hypothetical protein
LPLDSSPGRTYHAVPFTGQALFITRNLGAKLAPADRRLSAASEREILNNLSFGNDFH